SLFLPACPRAQVLGVDGAGGAAVLEIPSGTTVRFPAEATGTYRVSVAGDMSDRGPGTRARGCADYAGIIEPAVVTRGGAELGPSTRITKLP
ncbi:MAG TPA: hypothetical protein VFS16_06550, partial [Acidimicrobiia bacterium]|nr:hypothetical protein [Acidimicrobiia bacterium]